MTESKEQPVEEKVGEKETVVSNKTTEEKVKEKIEEVKETSKEATNKEVEEKTDEVKEIAEEEKKPVVEKVVVEDKIKEELLPETSKDTDKDFDWESYSNADVYSKSEREKLASEYDNTLSTIAEKQVLDGTVIAMNKREVVVNIGFKSDGVISVNEFRYNPELKVGDKVEVYIESQEDHKGQLVLSHSKARTLRSWDKVNEVHDSREVVKGFIKSRTKGGMIVDLFGIEAFLPGSQIDVKPIRDYDIYVGKTMEFEVIKINPEFKNVVVSHKTLIEAELEKQKIEIMSKLEKGQVLEGTVKNITSYGVFVDLGGVDGLIHITDLSWGRISHPTEIVKELDEKISVVILDFDDNKKRIALGVKQLTPHPWDKLDADLKVGDIVKGKVVVLADYGAFIEIDYGVEGLIHVSEMSWSQHLRSAQDFMKVGDEVEAQVLTLDREERKMSLGIKQLKEDPWNNILEKYPVGSKHTATVRNFTSFGVFAELEEGIDGLIHVSDLSWTKKIKHPAEFTSIGSPIEVVVLELNHENKRLSLGHKQLEENPWDVFETLFDEGSIHEGTIANIADKGALIKLPYGAEGFSTPKHLTKEDGSTVKKGDVLDFKVIEFNKNAKKIIVSHARTWEEQKRVAQEAENKSTKANMRTINKSVEKTTLGDVSALADLKSKMEQETKKEK